MCKYMLRVIYRNKFSFATVISDNYHWQYKIWKKTTISKSFRKTWQTLSIYEKIDLATFLMKLLFVFSCWVGWFVLCALQNEASQTCALIQRQADKAWWSWWRRVDVDVGEVSVAYSGLFYQTTNNFESRLTPLEFCYAVTLRFVIFKSFYVVYQALFMVHIFIMFSPALHVYKNN